MSELKAEEVNAIRDLLKTQRLDIEQRLAALRTETQPVGLDLPIGRLSRMDAMQQQEMAAGQQRRIEQELQQIVSALDRLERYRYGLCFQCHEALPYQRLAIRPTTMLCYECQVQREARR